MMTSKWTGMVLALILAQTVHAEIKLPAVFADPMVLQRDIAVSIGNLFYINGLRKTVNGKATDTLFIQGDGKRNGGSDFTHTGS